MRELWDDLVAAGGDITSTRMAGLLLFKLLARFDPYFQSLLISNRTTFPTWEEVLPSLRQIEGHSAYRAGGPIDVDGALLSKDGSKKGKKKTKKTKKNDNADIKCSYCHKKGHKESECRKKKRDIDNAKDKPKASTAVASTSTPHESGSVLVATTESALTTTVGTWVVDSGATKHMTSQKVWLSALTPSHGHIVSMGDNHAVPVAGSGRISLFRTSPSTSRFETFEALYVPDLAFNLLSVASLDSQGAEIHFGGGMVTITDSSTSDVLARGQREGSLFQLTALLSRS